MTIPLRTGLNRPRTTLRRMPATRSRRGRPDLEQRLKAGLERYASDVPSAAFPTFLESLYFESLAGASPHPFPDPGRIAS
jgi:hypothetical protein